MEGFTAASKGEETRTQTGPVPGQSRASPLHSPKASPGPLTEGHPRGGMQPTPSPCRAPHLNSTLAHSQTQTNPPLGTMIQKPIEAVEGEDPLHFGEPSETSEHAHGHNVSHGNQGTRGFFPP